MFIIDVILDGFNHLSLLLARGFYFYPKSVLLLLKKVFSTEKFDKVINFLERRQNTSGYLLVVVLYLVVVAVIVNFLFF